MAGLDGFGVILEREETIDAEDYAPIANVSNLSGPAIEREQIDVTAHDSPDQWREYVFGLKDMGEISVDVNYVPETHDALLEDFLTPEPRNYRIVWPNSTVVWSFKAGLVSFEPEAPIDDKLAASLSFKPSGAPNLDAGDES